MKNKYFLIIFLVLCISIIPSVYSLTYPVTTNHNISITSTQAGDNATVGFKIYVNTTGIYFKNATLATGDGSVSVLFINNTNSIICKYNISSGVTTPSPCPTISAVGNYYVIGSNENQLLNKKYVAFSSYPVVGQVFNWTEEAYFNNCPNFSVGTNCGAPTTYTTYAERIQTVTFDQAENITSSPNISLTTRTPTDITNTNLLTQNASFTYSYNLTKLSIAFFSYSTNSTLTTCIHIINGTCLKQNGTTNIILGSNTTINNTYNLTHDQIYPSISNINDSAVSSNIFNITGNIDYISDAYNNFSLSQSNLIYQFQTNSTGIVSIYYYNSSYDFNSNVATSPNTHLLCNVNVSVANHSHSNFNWDNYCSFNINASGFIDTVKATTSGGFIIGGNNVLLYGYNGAVRNLVSQSTLNNGILWTSQNLTFRTELYQINGNDTFCFSGNGNYTAGSNPQTNGTICDTLDITIQPPSIPNMFIPNTSGFYKKFINITYEASTPIGGTISYYNISLLNNDSSFNTTIIGNNGVNTFYNWNTYTLNLSINISYIIKVEAKDSNGLTSFSIGEPFSVLTNGEINITPRTLFGNASITGFGNYSIYENGTLYNTSYSNNQLILDITKGNNYTISVIPFNYTNGTTTFIPIINYSIVHTYHFTQNSFIINFYNETSGLLLNQTISFFLISQYNNTNYTVYNGSLNITLLTPTEYTFRYYLNNDPTIPRDYFVTLNPYSYEVIKLYIIDSAISQYYLPIINNEKGIPIGNGTVKLLRYFNANNSYEVVEMSRTDTNGQAVLRVVPNYIYYKLYIEKDNNNILTSASKITSSTNAYTLNLQSSPLTSYNTETNIYRNISYNPTTKTFIIDWNDNTNDVISGCLVVDEYNNGIVSNLYSACSSGTTGSMIYTITPNNESRYEAQGYLNLNSRYSMISIGKKTIDFTNKYAVTGLIGIFIAIMVVLGFALIGGESGTRGTVVIGVFALLFVGVYGIIAYSFETIIGVVIIAGIILYKLRGG